MRGTMHKGRNLLREHSRFGMIMETLNLDIGEIRPERSTLPLRMTEVIKF